METLCLRSSTTSQTIRRSRCLIPRTGDVAKRYGLENAGMSMRWLARRCLRAAAGLSPLTNRMLVSPCGEAKPCIRSMLGLLHPRLGAHEVSGVGRSPGGLVRPPWGTVVLGCWGTDAVGDGAKPAKRCGCLGSGASAPCCFPWLLDVRGLTLGVGCEA